MHFAAATEVKQEIDTRSELPAAVASAKAFGVGLQEEVREHWRIE